MNYLNIHTDTLKSDAFIGAEPTERATWLCLLGWSVTQENGGTISNCKEWNDRKWQQLCGVTKDEVHANSELFTFSGQNLRIAYYPKAQEDEVIKKRVTAKANGKLGGRPKKKETNVGTNVGFKEKPTLESKNANQLTQQEPTSETVKEGNSNSNEKEVPPNPLKGEWDVFPKSCFAKSKTDQKRIKVIYNNPKMVFIGKWFGRCEKTLWSVSEAKALMDLNLTREEVELMGVYRNTEDAFHRKGVQSLLNNWSGELDKARAIKKAATSPKPTTQGPDGWEEEWKKLYPSEDSAPGKWSWVDDGAQEQIKEILKK
jgi:hypothetical protein